MTRRQNVAAAAVSFAVAAGAVATAAGGTRFARERERSGDMHRMTGGMHDMQDHDAMHAQMREACERTMGDQGGDDG